MSSKHKDLPPGSQAWASEVDKDHAELLALRDVVRRLAENAGIDMANPKRGINGGDTPSVQGTVGQKLSSLADVTTYNVADGQGLTWSQKGQTWLPTTPLSADGSIDVSAISYSHQDRGYGAITDASHYAYTAATDLSPWGGVAEVWGSEEVYIGAGDVSNGTGLIYMKLDLDGFHRPYISITAEDYADNSDSTFRLFSFGCRIDTPYIRGAVTTTANRPALGNSSDHVGAQVFDSDLKIPIWWTGTAWINAIGTTV